MRLALALVCFALTGGACATRAPFAGARDANADAPRDPSVPRAVGGGTAGYADAGNDASRTGTGCGVRVLVVFDRSLSMAEPWTSSGPKWEVAETSLAEALAPHASQLVVGALLFPTSETPTPSASCAPVDGLASQFPYEACSAFLARWSAAWSTPDLRGTTPIDSAFDAADAALAGAGAGTAVVLLTDGEPTCDGPVPAATRAASWRARGIRTWVVGLPGSSAGASYLSAIASAGGTDAPLTVDDPSALGTALSHIATSEISSQCGP
ncbi:MAG: vWA domain-containing protein [Sandaracinus sp.]